MEGEKKKNGLSLSIAVLYRNGQREQTPTSSQLLHLDGVAGWCEEIHLRQLHGVLRWRQGHVLWFAFGWTAVGQSAVGQRVLNRSVASLGLIVW